MKTVLQRFPRVSSRTLSTVHKSALNGFTANETAMYNKGRPSYSDECLRKMTNILLTFPKNGLNLVELGAGTGKFTHSFADFAAKNSAVLKIASYTAVEPSDGFRESLAASAPGNVVVVNGTGGNIPTATSSCDGVLVAQAFHWMATEETLKEIHRILQPERPMILVWNTYDYSKKWLQQIDKEILTSAYGSEMVPRQQTGKWRDCFNTETGNRLFSGISTWEGPSVHTGTQQLIFDRILSTSVIAEQSESARAKVKEHLTHILETHEELSEERKTGVYSIPYITEVAWVFGK